MDRQIAMAMSATLLVGFVALMLFGGLCVASSQTPSLPGPQQVFEQHLLALDEERPDDALALVDTSICGPGAIDSAPQAAVDLRRVGHTFSSAFTVEEVWIPEDGSEALLGLRTVPSVPLPSVVRMSKADGEWLLTCGEEAR